jgi:hypothetical protein
VKPVEQIRRILAAAVVVLALAGDAGAGEAGLSLPTGASEPGTARLELTTALQSDPEGSLRLQVVLEGPLEGEGADDLYAFNAVLVLPSGPISFVGGSMRKGDLLGTDGGNWMVTAGAPPGPGKSVTMGGSRIGAVPGVAVPSGSTVLCSFALLPDGPGPFTLEWEDAAFIDSHLKRVDAARFMGGSLQPGEGVQTPSSEDHP